MTFFEKLRDTFIIRDDYTKPINLPFNGKIGSKEHFEWVEQNFGKLRTDKKIKIEDNLLAKIDELLNEVNTILQCKEENGFLMVN